MMSFPDLDRVIADAHANGARVVVDNTVLSPILLRPLEHGADFVMHSASKIISGHHDALLGLISCARAGPRSVWARSVARPGSWRRRIRSG